MEEFNLFIVFFLFIVRAKPLRNKKGKANKSIKDSWISLESNLMTLKALTDYSRDNKKLWH
jgi:hypothetical protein